MKDPLHNQSKIDSPTLPVRGMNNMGNFGFKSAVRMMAGICRAYWHILQHNYPLLLDSWFAFQKNITCLSTPDILKSLFLSVGETAYRLPVWQRSPVSQVGRITTTLKATKFSLPIQIQLLLRGSGTHSYDEKRHTQKCQKKDSYY